MFTHTLSTQLPSIIKQKNEIDGGKKRIRKKKRKEKKREGKREFSISSVKNVPLMPAIWLELVL